MNRGWNRNAIGRALGTTDDDVISAWVEEFESADADLCLTHVGPNGVTEQFDGTLDLAVTTVDQEVERLLALAHGRENRDDDDLSDLDLEVRRLIELDRARNKRQ